MWAAFRFLVCCSLAVYRPVTEVMYYFQLSYVALYVCYTDSYMSLRLCHFLICCSISVIHYTDLSLRLCRLLSAFFMLLHVCYTIHYTGLSLRLCRRLSAVFSAAQYLSYRPVAQITWAASSFLKLYFYLLFLHLFSMVMCINFAFCRCSLSWLFYTPVFLGYVGLSALYVDLKLAILLTHSLKLRFYICFLICWYAPVFWGDVCNFQLSQVLLHSCTGTTPATVHIH
jgi:hypothetical protein